MQKTKKEIIKNLAEEMLIQSHEAMIKKVNFLLESGAIDIESWSIDDAPMIIPKCIVAAILQNESVQYEAKGTSFESKVKKEIKNLKCFI